MYIMNMSEASILYAAIRDTTVDAAWGIHSNNNNKPTQRKEPSCLQTQTHELTHDNSRMSRCTDEELPFMFSKFRF